MGRGQRGCSTSSHGLKSPPTKRGAEPSVYRAEGDRPGGPELGPHPCLRPPGPCLWPPHRRPSVSAKCIPHPRPAPVPEPIAVHTGGRCPSPRPPDVLQKETPASGSKGRHVSLGHRTASAAITFQTMTPSLPPTPAAGLARKTSLLMRPRVAAAKGTVLPRKWEGWGAPIRDGTLLTFHWGGKGHLTEAATLGHGEGLSREGGQRGLLRPLVPQGQGTDQLSLSWSSAQQCARQALHQAIW